MSHQPVNPDDLDLTAYALGEMTNSERIEFENRLQDSPDAQIELEAMDEITSLLSSSLRDEWRKEMKEPSLEVLPGAEERVVTGQFRTPKRAYVAAAAAFHEHLSPGRQRCRLEPDLNRGVVVRDRLEARKGPDRILP